MHFRPNYDGTRTEPVVLPSRIPNLMINGATGIAVGMATNIPPHNLNEVCTALIKLLDNPDLSAVQLCRYVKGPDFPTGGQMLNSPEELKEIYKGEVVGLELSYKGKEKSQMTVRSLNSAWKLWPLSMAQLSPAASRAIPRSPMHSPSPAQWRMQPMHASVGEAGRQ